MSSNSRPKPPVGGIDLLLIIVLVIGSLFLINAVLVDRLRLSGLSIVGMFALQTIVILGVIYLVAVCWRGATWAELGLRPADRKWYARGVLIAFLVIPLVGLVNFATTALTGELPRNPQIPMVAATGMSGPAMAGMIIVAGIAAPLVEELAFRGLLYGWLRQRFGVALAVIGSALAFSLLHGIPALIPAIGVLGVVLALIYEKSRSLWPAFIMHASFNTIMLVALYGMLAAGEPLAAP